jgi:putative oxidoreductase
MLAKLFNTDPDNYVQTILRLVLGIVFFAHGAQKMLGWFGGYGFSGTMNFFTHQAGIPAPFAFLAICAEFLGGIGLIVGFLSRIAAFGITCNMLVAIATVHHRFGLFMNWTGAQKGEGIEYHMLVLAITTAIMIAGAGALSIDGLLSRGRTGVVARGMKHAA